MLGIQSQPKYLMKMIEIIGELIPKERIFDRLADCKESIIDEQDKTQPNPSWYHSTPPTFK